MLNLLACRIGVAVCDIGGDCAGEEDGILGHDAYDIAPRFGREFSDVWMRQRWR